MWVWTESFCSKKKSSFPHRSNLCFSSPPFCFLTDTYTHTRKSKAGYEAAANSCTLQPGIARPKKHWFFNIWASTCTDPITAAWAIPLLGSNNVIDGGAKCHKGRHSWPWSRPLRWTGYECNVLNGMCFQEAGAVLHYFILPYTIIPSF